MEKNQFEALKEMMGFLFPIFKDLKNPKPLKIGISKDIFKLMDDYPTDGPLTKTKVRKFIAWYTNRKAYHKAVLQCRVRCHLDGTQDITDINASHLSHAKQKLAKRKKPFKKKKA